MLSDEALNAASVLANRLDECNVLLFPVKDSVLEELLQAGRADDRFVNRSADGVDLDVESVQYMANAPIVSPEGQIESDHTVAVDRFVTVAAKATQSHLSFARTVVSPAYEDLVQRVTTRLGTIEVSKLLNMEVIPDAIPDPLFNQVFEESIREYESTPFGNPVLGVRAGPPKTGPEVIEFMKTGSAAVDGDIAVWAARMGDGFFALVWKGVFDGNMENKLRDFIDHPETGADYACAIFLIARKLLSDPPIGIKMSIRAFEDHFVQYVTQSAVRLCQIVDKDRRDSEKGLLVRYSSNGVIHVNGTIYRSWLENGGSVDVLFGNATKAEPYHSVHHLNEHRLELLELWKNTSAAVLRTEANSRYIRIRAYLIEEFCNQLSRDLTDEDRLAGRSYDILVRDFKKLAYELPDSCFDNIYVAARTLVCRTRFAHTDAEFILTAIDEVMKANPELPVREAALIASIEYQARWMASQFRYETR